MDVLTLDLYSALLSNLEDDAIGQLSITSKNMGNITNELKDDAIFYKSRVENKLGYTIDRSYIGDWKGFYSILIKLDHSKVDWLTSVLSFSATNGNNLAIKVLLTDQRADPSSDNNSAIRKASENGHTKVVKLLLNYLADPYPDIQGASADSHTYFEQRLIADKRGETTALAGNALVLLSRRTKYSVDPSSKNNKAIRMASENGHLESVKLLLEDKRVDPSANHNGAIRMASLNGHIEVVKLLLSDKRRETKVSPAYAYAVDPSDPCNFAIRWASENGHLEVVKLLLSYQRVDPSDYNNNAIKFASENGHLDIVKLLLADKRVDPSAYNNYAIRRASTNNHLEIVKLLLADPRVNSSDINNEAITKASEKGNLDVVKLLLSSNKINLSVKTQVLKLSKLSYDMNYDNIERLAKIPLKELIQIGNKNIQDRDIIMTKYFWWLRLEILHNMANIKEDPFKLALQLER